MYGQADAILTHAVRQSKESVWHAGLVQEDLDPLQLSKDQRSALLNMLLQTMRLRLVMRDGRRTYALPQ